MLAAFHTDGSADPENNAPEATAGQVTAVASVEGQAHSMAVSMSAATATLPPFGTASRSVAVIPPTP